MSTRWKPTGEHRAAAVERLLSGLARTAFDLRENLKEVMTTRAGHRTPAAEPSTVPGPTGEIACR